jgi:hypothetical protein
VESGAGAGASSVAGDVAGVCAPAIKAIAIAATVIDCSKRYGFMYIDTVPSQNDVCYTTKRISTKNAGR